MELYTAAIIQGLGYSMMGLGIFITLKIFSIPDITTDGTYTLGGAVTAVALLNGMAPHIVLLLCLLSGAVAGIATGLIHTKLKVNALLAGILTMTALYSINLAIMGRSNIPLVNANSIMSGNNIFTEPATVMFLSVLIVVLGLTYILRSDFGIAMRATGDSKSMAVAMGVNVLRMKIIGLAIANALTALSAFLLVQYQKFADINMGIGIVISGLAAVIIGESLLRFFKAESILFQLLTVVAGTILFRLALAGALSLGLDPIYLKLLTALVVLFIVALGSRARKEAS